MYQALTILHVLVALSIIGLVLLQQGRGADAGAGFGGASNSVFGARGAASFLSRSTAILATVFFISSMTLAYFADKHDNKPVDIMDTVAPVEPAKRDLPQVVDVPAADTAADIPVGGDSVKPEGKKP